MNQDLLFQGIKEVNRCNECNKEIKKGYFWCYNCYCLRRGKKDD